MKLAVVSTYPPSITGTAEYAWHIVQGLGAREGAGPITVIADQPGMAEAGPIAVRRVWRANEAGSAARILREIGRLRPDAVWYNVSLAMFGTGATALGGFLLPGLTRRLGIRTVVTLHERPLADLTALGAPNGQLRRVGMGLAERLLLRGDTVCVTTDRHRRALLRTGSPGRARIVHLPLCGYAEPVLESTGEPATLLMLTSHAPHKKLPLLIEAFRLVRAAVPMASLVVAGIDHPRFPGYLAAMQQRYADESGIAWVGPVAAHDLGPLFRRATAVVVPYGVATGSSATIHQAIGAGRPVVASDLPTFRAMAEEEELWLEFFPPAIPGGWPRR